MVDTVLSIAEHFFAPETISAVHAYGTGKVNDTYCVEISGKSTARFILQRLSSAVFAHPEWIMENLRLLSDHISAKLSGDSGSRFEVPCLHQTSKGHDFLRDKNGSCWRVLHFIEQSNSFETVESSFQAREVGKALGRFHHLLSDLDPARLHDTLPGFHVTPGYLAQYDGVVAQGDGSSADIRFCRDFIEQRRRMATVLEDAAKQGILLRRPIHGDPKLSNFLFDSVSGQAVSLIDLDTVKPGLIHYDIGDCLRSCCNRAGEEYSPADVSFDTDLCRAILRGYVEEGKAFLRPVDYDFLYDSVRLISFELGLRFFTDHLSGNVYFKTSRPGLNLQRAMVQFALTASIEKQQQEIELIVREVR